MTSQLSTLFAALILLGTGCAKVVDKTTYTPTNKDAQQPYVPAPDSELSPNKTTRVTSTTFCQPAADGTYPADASTMNGGQTTDNANGRYYWAEGGGCIARPIREAWATSMNQGLMVWTERGNSGTYTMAPPPAGIVRFFDVEYTHSEAVATVHWNMTWYHSVVAGTPQSPERILINFRRYKGTKYIKYWEGSIILTKLSENVTGIWVRNQINATRVTEVNAKGGANDIITKLRTGAPATDILP